MPIEVTADRWVAQTVFWSRAVGAISLLAAGAILLFADWIVIGLPLEFWIAMVFAGPSILYFVLSCFVPRFHGGICTTILLFAIAHAISMLIGAIFFTGPDERPVFVILAIALAAGLGNLAVSAFWARRMIRHGMYAVDGRRGYEVLPPQPLDLEPPQSIFNDLEK
jgi:hypothetical protein